MRRVLALSLFMLALLLLTACSGLTAAGNETETLVVYSGRSESLVGPIITEFEEVSGIDVEVRWGDTPELAATLLEEGENSPADVFYAQDPGGLGAVVDLLQPLPAELIEPVEPRFRDPQNRWVGISGRARVVVYNTERLSPADLPADLRSFADPQWDGRLGWAPTNASFQTMVTAMRALWGEEETLAWLQGIQANNPVVFDGNTPIVAAVGAGEIDAGFVNHYYLYRFLQEEGESFPARNYYVPSGGPDALVMVSGAGILKTAKNPEAAQRFIDFMLSKVAQQYFATQTYEYPVIEGVVSPRELTPLAELNTPDIELAALSDLAGTVALLQQAGILP